MKIADAKKGFSLTELLVVVAIISLLVGIGITAAKGLLASFESSRGVKNVISAALSSARAMALKEDQYVGIRFQQNPAGDQYLIFIIHEPDWGSPANGFRAIEGRKPMKLPADVGLMDLRLVDRVYDALGHILEMNDVAIDDDTLIDESVEIAETSTFSIVFSKSGKIITHQVWVRNKDGFTGTNNGSIDDVFNTMTNVDGGMGMFYQDDYPDDGFGPEYSRNSFVIYSKREFKKINSAGRYTDYLQHLRKEYVNPYSGELVVD
jgi:prepilin-type N-terminal cleavage/methylation domain-containing protein